MPLIFRGFLHFLLVAQSEKYGIPDRFGTTLRKVLV